MTATAASYASVVQDLYVTYFGRPADYFGLQNFEKALLAANAPTDLAGLNSAYATNTAVKALVDSFGTSAESVALYGAVTTSSASAAAFVNAIYENLFNRASDVAGLTFWTNAITSGKLTLGDAALSIAAGASAAAGTSAQSATDWQSVQNKVTVAGNFTTTLGDYPASNPNGTAIADYSGDSAAASARSFLHTVDGTMTAAAAAALDVTGAIAAIVNNAPGNNFTLTTGPDTFVGGTGNNVFNATGLTFTALDNLTGNTTGQNTLNIVDATSSLTVPPTGVTLTNIQTVNITALDGVGHNSSTILDLSGAVGLTTLNVSNTSGSDYLKVGANTAVTVNNQATSGGYVEIHGGSTISATTTSDVYVYGGSGTTSVKVTNGDYIYVKDGNYGSSPVAANSITSVTLSNMYDYAEIYDDALSTLSITAGATKGSTTAGAYVYADTGKGTGELDVTIAGLSGATIQDDYTHTMSVMATTASKIALSATAATTLNLGGAGALTISTLTDTVETAVNVTGAGGVSVDLSSAAAAVTVDASASTGANTVTLNASSSYTGGSGGSTVTESGIAITGKVDGGTGTNNTLLVSGTVADLSTLTAAAMAHFTDFQTIGFTGAYGTTGSTLDLALLPSSITNVELGGTAGAAITIKDGVATTALTFEHGIGQAVTYTEKTAGGALTVNIGDATTTSAYTNSLTAATVKSVNITSNDSTTSAVTHVLNGAFAAATTVTITGDAGLNLAATLTAATKIDGSAMTGYLEATSAVTSGATISAGTGGAYLTGVADAKHGDTISVGATAAGLTTDVNVYDGAGANTISIGDNNSKGYTYVDITGDGNNTVTIGNTASTGSYAEVVAGNGNNTVTIGTNAGTGSSDVSVGNGNNTVKIGAYSGSNEVYVSAGNGNNLINVGDYTGTGTGVFITVGNGNNNTANNAGITVGAGASDITTGTGLNNITLGAGAVNTLHVVAGANVSTYDMVSGWAKGDVIETATPITTASAAFDASNFTNALDPATNTFQQFADYAIKNIATSAGSAAWFQYGGNTYIIEDVVGGGTAFNNGTDIMIKLVGTVDLSKTTIDSSGHLVHG